MELFYCLRIEREKSLIRTTKRRVHFIKRTRKYRSTPGPILGHFRSVIVFIWSIFLVFFFFLYLDCAPITHEHVQSDLCGGTQRASRSRVGFSIGSMPNVLPSSRRVHLPRYLPAGVCYVVCSGRREVVNCAITTCVCVRRTCRAPRSEHLISVSTPEGDGDALKCACNTPRERE